MHIVGRKVEQDKLEQCILSGRPEFVVVYGRRRVGKTFLIKEYFNNIFSFYSTGLLDGKTRSQLKAFNEALGEYGDAEKNIPKEDPAIRHMRRMIMTTVTATELPAPIAVI